VGWFFFFIVSAATAYYSAVIGWVLYYGVGEVAAAAGVGYDPSAILPPDTGFNVRSFVLQMIATGVVIAGCGAVLVRGLRAGIERASVVIMPMVLVILVLLMVRALTLPGAAAGVEWYILKFQLADVTPGVVVAALGHAMFSLSLGGTFMVVYGSYLPEHEPLGRNAAWTAMGDTLSGILAGFAIFPAVFSFRLEPGAGPALLFSTLPRVFESMPLGRLFGLLFYVGLLGAAWLSAIAAFEVLVAGLTDNTTIGRKRAVWIMAAAVFLLAIPPSINNRIFVPWDLTFGSGMQTLGALMAVIAVGWCLNRSALLQELNSGGSSVPPWLIHWIRYGIPLVILAVGIWWFTTSVLA
jgi:NSS family neurotransmitter:Na+ symporter